MAFLQLSGIDKSYAGTAALSHIDLSIHAGEILALVGENGAGKSTLIEIIAGMKAPDRGELYIDGEQVDISAPRSAWAAGISVVHQHSHLLPDLSLAENRALRVGYTLRQSGMINWPAVEDRARSDGASLAPFVDVKRRADKLNAVEKQLVELAFALADKPALLVLDEPTAALPQHEAEQLLASVRTYAENGGAVLFVSHRLEEVFSLADRIAVLRDGERVWLGHAEETDRTALVATMVGRPVSTAARQRPRVQGDETALSVRNFSSSDGACSDVNIRLQKGEIYGLYGLVGAGHDALCQALAGLRPARGDLFLRGHNLGKQTAIERRIKGLVYVPGDRRTQGIFYALSSGENMAIGSEGVGWLQRDREDRAVSEAIDTLHVRTLNPDQPIGQLSGGNQQKVLLGRGLLRDPDVLLIEEPTQGVDVAAKAEIHAHLRARANRGMTILFASADLEEILSLSDRVGTMREGALVGEWPAVSAQREEIVERALPRLKKTEESISSAHRSIPWRLLTLCIINAFLAAISAYLAPDGLQNALDVLLNNAVLLIGALAVGCVIIAGSIDISIGSLLGLSAVLAGLADRAGLSPVYTASIALAAGATGGWLNGWIATRSRVHAIVVTLGTMAIYRGLIIEWSGGRWILGLSDGLRALAHSTPVGIPMLLWLALSTWLAMWVLLRYSRLGRRMYAVGSAPRAARYVGITERAVLPWAFALCGLLIGLAGLLQAARFGQVQTNMGTGFELQAIAAAVIGGVHIAGGRGSAAGIALGVLLIGQLANALVLLHVPAYWEDLFLGAVILSTLVLEKREERR